MRLGALMGLVQGLSLDPMRLGTLMGLLQGPILGPYAARGSVEPIGLGYDHSVPDPAPLVWLCWT